MTSWRPRWVSQIEGGQRSSGVAGAHGVAFGQGANVEEGERLLALEELEARDLA